ncbi:hypothetical protein Bbelb_006870 [Branchiostoma belcheri]|nr:hypothetical protein Bbelb_006870 [Branchiostoma belcheri]
MLTGILAGGWVWDVLLRLLLLLSLGRYQTCASGTDVDAGIVSDLRTNTSHRTSQLYETSPDASRRRRSVHYFSASAEALLSPRQLCPSLLRDLQISAACRAGCCKAAARCSIVHQQEIRLKGCLFCGAEIARSRDVRTRLADLCPANPHIAAQNSVSSVSAAPMQQFIRSRSGLGGTFRAVGPFRQFAETCRSVVRACSASLVTWLVMVEGGGDGTQAVTVVDVSSALRSPFWPARSDLFSP